MAANTIDSNSKKASRAYETDYYGWIEDQISLLEAGRLSEIDTENIAEEIKDIASREFDKLENALIALTYNLLKWDLLPDRRSTSAVLSIDAHREQIAALLRRNPSLLNEASEALSEAYIYATYDIMRDADLPESIFALACPYDLDTVRTREIVFNMVKSPSGGENA